MASDLPPKSVSADMDRIFKPLSERAPGDSLGQGRSLGKARAGGKRDLRVFTMVAPALVLVAGAALALGYGQQAQAPKPAPSTGSVALARPSSGTGIAAAARPVPPRVTASGGEQGGIVPTVALADGASKRQAEAAMAVSRTPAAEARAPRYARPARMLSRAAMAGTGPAMRPARSRDAVAEAIASAQCPPGSPDDRCIYQDVLNADARLRQAYRRARQAGVPYGQLESVNRQWNRARDASQDDPDGTIQRYDRLADSLDRARQEGGE